MSTATVSNVLNGKGSFSAKTRDLVLRIAREQGYVANFATKSLRESSTKTIALLTPDVSNPFFSLLVQRVETLLYDAGYTCYICDTYNDSERIDRYLSGLTQRQVDGLVFVSGHVDVDALSLSPALPVLMLDATGGSRRRWTVSAVNDLSAIVRDNVRLLARRGCQHIATLAVYSGADTLHDDWMGLKSTLGEFGLKLDRNLADRRVFPAIDPVTSGTRKEDLLMNPQEAPLIWAVRRILANLNNTERAMNMLIKSLRQTDTNTEFLLRTAKKMQGRAASDIVEF